jgi:uncharacterized membrane protein (DUF4010 family)
VNPDINWPQVAGILIAAAGGAAIGVERERSSRPGNAHALFAGIRTFTLLGGLGGAAGLLWTLGFEALATTLLGGAAALVVAAYVMASRKDVGSTTEVAAFIVLAAGVFAGSGHWRLASGIVAITAVLLAEKSQLHDWVERVPEKGVRSGFRFALMALVVLPLVPEGPFGPWGGVRPRELWIVVLLISGLSFLGYAARAIVGPGKGSVLSGLLGGLISSTNVTLSFARTSRVEPQSGGPLALGVITACTVMFVRVGIATALLNPALGLVILPYVGVPAVVGTLVAIWGLTRKHEGAEGFTEATNPLQVGAALQMAALFQAVLFALQAVKDWWGGAGLVLSGALLGLTDVDALTIAMAKAEVAPTQAAMAVGVGCLANTLVKLSIALVVGRGRFRPAAATGFAMLLAGLALGFFLAWPR